MSSHYWSWNLNDYRGSAKSPMEQLAGLLHPFGSRTRIMAVLDLKGFFDESGTDAKSDLVTLAGYLGPAADWAKLEEAWSPILVNERAPFYHATDAEADPPRGKYRGWSVEKARRLTDRLTEVVASNTSLVGVGVYVEAKDWLAAAELIKPYFVGKDAENFAKHPFALPYQILVKSCIAVVMEHLNPDLPSDESVAFVFEDNDWKHPALSGYDILKKNHPQRHRFGTIAFPEKQKYAGLQAADLFAWSYRRVKTVQLGYAKSQIQRSFLSLIRRDFELRQVTRANLENQLRQAMDLMVKSRVCSPSP